MVQLDLAFLLVLRALQLVLHTSHNVAGRLAVWAPAMKHRTDHESMQGSNVRLQRQVVRPPHCRTVSPMRLII